MAWTEKKPCCRYTKCPNTEEVEGKGLQTSVKEAWRGFCVDCYNSLHQTTDRMITRVKSATGRQIYDDEWSRKFIACVEPDCEDTDQVSIETSKKHYALGFCKKCYILFATLLSVCGACRKLKPVEKNTDKGPVCKKCYKQPEKECIECGQPKRATENTDKGPVCKRCYKQPEKECCICKDMLPPSKKTDEGYICYKCYERSEEKCYSCCKTKPVHKRTEKGPICNKCYQKKLRAQKKKKKSNQSAS